MVVQRNKGDSSDRYVDKLVGIISQIPSDGRDVHNIRCRFAIENLPS